MDREERERLVVTCRVGSRRDGVALGVAVSRVGRGCSAAMRLVPKRRSGLARVDEDSREGRDRQVEIKCDVGCRVGQVWTGKA